METKKKKLSKGGTLAIAIIWTATTIMWTVTAVLRFTVPYVDEGLQILTVLTLLASLAACVANWYRYVNYEE